MVKPKSTAPFRKKTLFLTFIGFIFFEFVLFIIFFKYLKNSLGPELIDPVNKTVGFVQYTNYPYYIDLITYLLLLIAPIIFLSVVKFFHRT